LVIRTLDGAGAVIFLMWYLTWRGFLRQLWRRARPGRDVPEAERRPAGIAFGGIGSVAGDESREGTGDGIWQQGPRA
jgi:hypothetical protein